jgi:hypothetical protein
LASQTPGPGQDQDTCSAGHGGLDAPQVHLLLDGQTFDGHLHHYQKSALTSMNFEAKKTMKNGKYLYMIWLKFTTFLVCKMERLGVHF